MDKARDPRTPIEAARIWAGFPSALQAAMALGIPQGDYNKFETGERKPGRDRLVVIAKGFGCPLGALVGLESLPEVSSTQEAV